MGRKNRNARSRHTEMKGRAKRFAGEFLPNEIFRDLREDFAPAGKYPADDGWDDDLNIEVIEVRPREGQNIQENGNEGQLGDHRNGDYREPGHRESGYREAGITFEKADGNLTAGSTTAPTEDASGANENEGDSINKKIRAFKRCLVEKPMLFVIAFAFLAIIIWLLTTPEIPGITDRIRYKETQSETAKSTEALMETVTVSRAGKEAEPVKQNADKPGSNPFAKDETVPKKAETGKPEKAEKSTDRKAAARTGSAEVDSTEAAGMPAQNPVPETENWKEKIFGSDAGFVQDKQVFITGLSASEKEKLSFRESDFVKAVSIFLSSKRIDARTVEFLRKMDISADGAQEYLAVLPGHDNFYLVVLMYPEYPGKYILSFLDLDGLAGSLEEKEKQKKDSTPETSAVNTPVQALQTQPAATTPPVQSQAPVQTQNAAPEEEKYDATNLTIMAVPTTLSNYLDNRYELQYTLYDYLYRNGKQDVGTAAVKDYSIDPDSRAATITFELDDGSMVSGSYDKNTNQYEYHE